MQPECSRKWDANSPHGNHIEGTAPRVRGAHGGARKQCPRWEAIRQNIEGHGWFDPTRHHHGFVVEHALWQRESRPAAAGNEKPPAAEAAVMALSGNAEASNA